MIYLNIYTVFLLILKRYRDRRVHERPHQNVAILIKNHTGGRNPLLWGRSWTRRSRFKMKRNIVIYTKTREILKQFSITITLTI